MDIKFLSIAILLFIGMSSIFSTCKKGGLGCANTVYSFQVGESITPDKDSIRIGDTLFLNVNTSTKLNDLQTAILVDYSNTSNLGNVVTLLKFLPSDTVIGAINNFNLVMLKGTKVYSVDPSSQQQVLFDEENGSYRFNLEIIAKDYNTPHFSDRQLR